DAVLVGAAQLRLLDVGELLGWVGSVSVAVEVEEQAGHDAAHPGQRHDGPGQQFTPAERRLLQHIGLPYSVAHPLGGVLPAGASSPTWNSDWISPRMIGTSRGATKPSRTIPSLQSRTVRTTRSSMTICCPVSRVRTSIKSVLSLAPRKTRECKRGAALFGREIALSGQLTRFEREDGLKPLGKSGRNSFRLVIIRPDRLLDGDLQGADAGA